MKLPIFIGLRYTGASQGTQFVSFFSGVSISGLVLGVGLLIAVLSIMNGFDRELRERILGLVPQAAIYQKHGIANWQEMSSELEQSSDVIAAAPFVRVQALVSARGQAEPVMLFGVDSGRELRVSRIGDYLTEGELKSLESDESNMILGAALAEKLSVEEGEQLMLIAPSAEEGAAPRIKYFKLVKVLKTQTELDNALAITGLKQAAALTAEPDKVTGIRLKVRDLFEARSIVWQEIMRLGRDYYGSSWINSHGNLYQAIHMSKKLIAILMSLIVAIATFNVLSTLVMVVVEKQGDIAILRTMGLTTGDVMKIFITQGVLIGFIGTALGVLFGVFLSVVVEPFVRWLEIALGTQFMKSDTYPLTYLPTEIVWADIVQISATALIMCCLATIYPAWKASKSQPAEILRYE